MFYDTFLRLCREVNKAPNAVARELGLSNSAVTYWKRGSIPKSDTLLKLSNYFGVSPEELLSEEPDPYGEHLHRDKGVKIPVLSVAGAGISQYAIHTFDQDDPDSWEEIKQIPAGEGQYFALRIRGDSMEPLIRHGEIVIVRPQNEYSDGDVVIALINGCEGLCKRLKYKSDGIALLSENPDYDPIYYTEKQCRELPVQIVGHCIERRGKI